MQNHLKILIITSCFGSLCLLIVNFTVTGKRDAHQAGSNDSNKEKHGQTAIKFELTPELRSKLENEFQNRRERVEYACTTVDHQNETMLHRALSKMVIDLKDKLTWCPVYKAASSMWMKNFAVLSGFSTSESLHLNRDFDFSSIVKQKYPNIDNTEESLKFISMTTKFIIVRHPFERLLSAYRDKLEHMQGREFYFKHYGQYITQKYRSKQSNLTSLEPSFTEFLQFIAEEKRFDEHWIPFFDSCQPCSIDYDYILKFESLSDEYNFLILENNLQYYLNYTTSERINTSSQGITNSAIAKKYFKDVSASLLLSIFQIYELDFLSFSYSPTEYYYMTSDANRESDNALK